MRTTRSPSCRSTTNRAIAHIAILLAAISIVSAQARRAFAQAKGPPNQSTIPVHWIWTATNDAATKVITFRRSFAVEKTVQSARLRLSADFCGARAKLNGSRLIDVAPYVQQQLLDVTDTIRRGQNEIIIEADRMAGPAAVAASITIVFTDQSRSEIVTNGDWSVHVRDESGRDSAVMLAADLGNVAEEFWGTTRRGIDVSAFENYEQWQQAKTDSKYLQTPRFWLAPGFEIAELRAAQSEEGSWIAMAFDGQGRLTISREDRGFLRMTLAADRKSIAKVESVAAPLEECRGLQYDGEWLYANANNSKAMYRLKISSDCQPIDLEKLREFSGGVGHGRNDLVISPPSAARFVYSIHGDSVDVPKESIVDYSSPLSETKKLPRRPEGCLVRADLSGNKWELICHGLRNPYGIALHSSGDPFTFDADNEFDMGMPWYRPTRILHLMTGGDSGYRESSGKLPPRFHDQPDYAPPLFDIGRSSPTAVMFGYDLSFPESYRRALYVLDWTYGRVIAIHLSMRGATWRVGSELFLQGKPLNVTDVAAGPDGAMYLITGGRKTQSALYRVQFVGGADVARQQTIQAPEKKDTISGRSHEKEAEHFAVELRKSRTDFSTFAVATKPTAEESAAMLEIILQKGLADHDPVYRHAARVALERLPIRDWRAAIIESRDQAVQLRGLLAVARERDAKDGEAIVDRLLKTAPTTLPLDLQFVWVRLANLAREVNPEVVRQRSDEIENSLTKLWEHGRANSPTGWARRVSPEGSQEELRRRIAYLLGDLDSTRIASLAAAELLESTVQEDQLAGLFALRSVRAGWSIELREKQLDTLNQVPKMLGGQGLPTFEAWLRSETLKSFTDDERTKLASKLEAPKEEGEPLPAPRPIVRKWELSNFDNRALAQTGNPERGKQIFRDALCSRCHRVGLRGAAVGPELTMVSRRFSRRDILESILLPSLSVAENYRLDNIVTDGGKSYTGRVLFEGDYRSEKLKLLTDSLRPDSVVEIDKKEIVEHKSTAASPMPQGLLDSFTQTDILDLLAYLESTDR